jgi:Na+/H+-dicarboxylate symporter
MTPLVATMGIPVEGIGLLIAVDAIPDIGATTVNVTGDLLASAIVTRARGGRAVTPSVAGS